MDAVQKDLQDKLAHTSLSARQAREGITACFILTNRKFLRRRLGDERPTDEIDAATRALVDQVYAEQGISARNPTLPDLRRAWRTLDEQLGFEADPDLMAHHVQVIERLFELAKGGKASERTL
ncbi:MAG: hypothetical protein PVF45_03525 [Anaerolineae bacterium]|jgi:hypothetical protein